MFIIYMNQDKHTEKSKEKEEENIITNDDDFVIFNNGEKILGGGFHVNSLLLKHKKSPMHTLNQNFRGGDSNVSDIYNYLAIPAGIFYEPNKLGGRRENTNNIADKVIEEQDIDEDLYNKLVKLASVDGYNKVNQKKDKRKSRKIEDQRKINVNNKKHTKKHIQK